MDGNLRRTMTLEGQRDPALDYAVNGEPPAKKIKISSNQPLRKRSRPHMTQPTGISGALQ
jgi:hypothetical protein